MICELHLCDYNVTVSPVATSDHTVQDKLWNLSGLSTPSVPTDDDHLLLLDHCHYVSCLGCYGQQLSSAQALKNEN